MKSSAVLEDADPSAPVRPRRLGGLYPARLLFKRPRKWSLLGAVAVGMLVAVTLICLVPLYINLGSDAQLQAALVRAPTQIDVETQVTATQLEPFVADSVQTLVQGMAQAQLGALAADSTTYLEAPYLNYSSVNGQKLAVADPTLVGARAQSFVYDFQRTQPHMQLIAGRFPRDVPSGQPAEVLATPQSDLKVGDTIVFARPDATHQTATARVVGIWFPKNESDAYWNGRSFRPPVFTVDSKSPPPPPPSYPFLYTHDGFFNTLGHFNPSLGMVVHFVYYTHPASLTAQNMRSIADGIHNFRLNLVLNIRNVPSVSSAQIFTQLDTIIKLVLQQYALLAQPLYIVAAQVVGLALFFVFAVAGLLIESQASEIAVLKSRGASGSQVVSAYAVQGIALAAVAVAAGPFAAAALSLLLVRLLVPGVESLVTSIGGDYVAHAVDPNSTLVPALIGGGLGAAALIAAAMQAMRRDVRAYHQELGRESHVPLWKRYNLDVGLALLCVVGYVELGDFGGLGARSALIQSGSGQPSPLLLATPSLLLLAGGLIALRLFPFAARLGTRLAARSRGVTGILSFAQLSRASGSFTRLMLLLTLSVGIALFALTFRASLGRNAADRAAFQTGGDERVVVANQIEGTRYVTDVQASLAHLPGATAVTGILRAQFNTLPNQGNREISVLGIDPATFAQAAYWRSDYSDRPLPELLNALRQHAQPENAGQLSAPIWALVSPAFASSLGLAPGDRFALVPQVSGTDTLNYVVGGILNAFPTIYDSAGSGYIVANTADLVAGAAPYVSDGITLNGPDEYWLRTTGNALDDNARATQLTDPNLFVQTTTDRRSLEVFFQTDALLNGMTGLLLAGAATAGVLAVLGGIVYAQTAARRRTVQFAILRTIGVSGRELTNMLLSEQLVIYLFGLIGGTLLGLVLATATLPFLAFGSTLADPASLGVPPPLLVVSLGSTAIFYAVVVVAFALALGWQRVAAGRGVLDRKLRLGDD